LRENLRRIAKLELQSEIEVHSSPPWNYRNRSRLQIQTKPTFAAGYFKLASHDLLAVEECPISSPLINRGIACLWQSGRAGKVPEGVREVEFFANADDTQLLVDVGCAGAARRAAVRAWAEELRAAMPEIAGVVAFREPNPGDRKAGAPEILVTVGAAYLTYQTQRAAYRVSAGSFFQTNRHLTDELVKIVTGGRSGELVLDLYAGAGLFSTALACDFHHVVSVESSQTSSADLAYNQPSNGETVQATAEQYLAGSKNTGRVGDGAAFPHVANKPDLVVVDPPRSGLGERVSGLLATLGAPRVIYVSCDPATLARDLVPLLAAGYRVEQVHLVDLFPQTYHLESVVHLIR
jgi:23S rRNA (uracil1939-C5)-methyltransferase